MVTWQSNLLGDDVAPAESARWENRRDGHKPRHLLRVHRSDLERMLADLVDGRIAEVHAAPWCVGRGS